MTGPTTAQRIATTRRVPYLLGGAVLMLLLSIVLATLTYANFRGLADANSWNVHTYKVLEQVTGLRIALGAEESRLRGFALTSDPKYLASIPGLEKSGAKALNELIKLTADNAPQQSRIVHFGDEYAIWRQRYVSVGDKNLSLVAKRLTQKTPERRLSLLYLQTKLDVFEATERALLTERGQVQQKSQQRTARFLLFGSSFSIFFTGLLTLMLGLQTRAMSAFNTRLQQSQQQLQVVLDNAPLVLYSLDNEERFTLMVGSGVPSLGIGDAPVIGRTISEVMGAQHPSLLRVREALQGQPSVSRSAVKDHVFESYRQPLMGEGGQIVGMIGVGLEITERQQAEEALQASEVRYRSVIESLQEVIFQVDREGRWTFLNPAWTTTLGYEVESSVGRDSLDFLLPGDRERTQKLFASLFNGETGAVQAEIRFLTRDGRVRWLDLQAQTQYDQSGRFVEVTGTLNDISDRKEAEAALQATTTLQRAILDGAAYSIIATSPNGIITSFNRAAETMLGYRSEEVCGLKSQSIFHDSREIESCARQMSEDLGRTIEPGFQVFVEKALDEVSNESEWTYIRRDGSRFPVRLSTSVLRDENGKITGYVDIGHDLTESRRAEKLKNEFVSVVSHELRTPLTSIRGALGLLVGGVAGPLPAGAMQMLEIAQKNSDRLVLLINDILDIEKIESGKMRFDLKTLSVGELLKSAVEVNESYATALGVRLKLESPFKAKDGSELRFVGDEGRIQQVLANLLSNAAKFTPSGGVVTVGAKTVEREGNSWVRIFVRDQGPGAPEEFVPRLFEKFAQADSSSTRKKGGTGLGLAIARAIIEKHDGYIDYLPPEKDEVGSTFYFELPLQSIDEESEFNFEPVDSTLPRVLICEDDLGVAAVLADLIGQNGYESDIANSCSEARALLKLRSYIGMTLELVLQDGDGLELLAEIRSKESTKLLPVVVISAYSASGDIYGEAFGVVDWLCKPLDSDRLLAAIRRFGIGRQPRVLHIEDDEDVRKVTQAIVGDHAKVVAAASLREARAILENEHFDLAILDIGLPDGSGFDLVPVLSGCKPPIPIVLYSATEVTFEQARTVTASLVKSRTDNDALRETIQRFLPAQVK